MWLRARTGAVVLSLTILSSVVGGTLKAGEFTERFKEAFSAIERSDYAAAAEIFRSMAEEGSAPAQFNLGQMYLGNNIPKNYREAAKWLRRAAEQGDPLAQSSLSGLYLNGWGVSQDYIEAYKWAALAHLRRKPIMGGTEADLAEVASKMTAAEIARARQLVYEWRPKPER